MSERRVVDHGTTHVAFAAEDRDQVDAFHAAALAAGGRDNGAPGPRAQYSPGYYGAFVIDPDGHNVEAVFHDPDARSGPAADAAAEHRTGAGDPAADHRSAAAPG